mmetsp:Transcript_11575/g.23523  ORF Transcript_11575/g.23523 Transcript_11575/m.23523 type:complete len:202 (-) Transcript_11575:273-878(-)
MILWKVVCPMESFCSCFPITFTVKNQFWAYWMRGKFTTTMSSGQDQRRTLHVNRQAIRRRGSSTSPFDHRRAVIRFGQKGSTWRQVCHPRGFTEPRLTETKHHTTQIEEFEREDAEYEENYDYSPSPSSIQRPPNKVALLEFLEGRNSPTQGKTGRAGATQIFTHRPDHIRFGYCPPHTVHTTTRQGTGRRNVGMRSCGSQ